MRCALTVGFAFLALSIPAWGENDVPEKPRAVSVLSSQIWKTRPVRRDTPLREENITDREVLQTEGVMQELYPGSIVHISAVTTGCSCEDGSHCTEQVWSVADRDGVSNELALSKIDGKWQLGPLQAWWLIRDRIWETYRKSRHEPGDSKRIDLGEYLRRAHEHDKGGSQLPFNHNDH